MKTMTCSQMGGTCEAEMTANSAEEMIAQGMAHVAEAHPELAAQIEAMSAEEKETWSTEFHAKWDAAPEAEAEEVPAAE